MNTTSFNIASVKKTTIKNSLRVLFICLMCTFGFITRGVAQGLDDPSTEDPAVPVDGGISLLLAAGVAYGASRWKRPKENE